jgi:hypothetical protein
MHASSMVCEGEHPLAPVYTQALSMPPGDERDVEMERLRIFANMLVSQLQAMVDYGVPVRTAALPARRKHWLMVCSARVRR